MLEPGRRVFGHLIFDPRIALSWVVFALFGAVTAWVLVQMNHPPAVPPRAPVAQAAVPQTQTAAAPAPAVRKGSRNRHRKPAPPPVKQAVAAPVVQPAPVPEWKPKSAGTIALTSLSYGFAGWSLYWGIPACMWLLVQIVKRVLKSWSSITTWASFLIGFWPAVITAALLLVGGFYYSIFGGGLFHFCRRWWRLCHPRPLQPATVAPQVYAQSAQPMLFPSAPPADSGEQGLRTLNGLLQSGLITREEYDVRRSRILDAMVGGQAPSERRPPPPDAGPPSH
jgi:hypothetical protein